MWEIKIAHEFLFENAIWIWTDDSFSIEIKRTCKELQNETNPSSVAPFVWKWCSTEGERVRKSSYKPVNFADLLHLTARNKGVDAKNWQYSDSIEQKSYFMSFLMQFSDSKSHNLLRKCVVFIGPDWREKPCRLPRKHAPWEAADTSFFVSLILSFFTGFFTPFRTNENDAFS